MGTMEVYVNSEGRAVIECPHCKNARTFHVDKFKEAKRKVKVRCGCHTEFYVSLEFGKTVYKEDDIRGYFTKFDDISDWEKMLITDLSETGVGFVAPTGHRLKGGDKLKVKFCLLNGPRRSLVEKDAVVRWVAGGNTGCQFSKPLGWGDSPDHPLHAYLVASSH
ncbi:MAG: PilZ domain-containing protein [Thermodesulfobacteriota bacterium]|nr:PilZ domain-containing protein [Thermodesulfobacteriota bacterium]